MSLIVRQATSEDKEAACKVFKSAWLFLIEKVLGYKEDEAFSLSQKVKPTIVAELNESVVGLAEITDGVLNRLYVDPQSHGRGVGSALLEAAETLGARTLWVDEGNLPARRLYESRGWAWDGCADPGRHWPQYRVLRYSRVTVVNS